jgi:2-polyprenyl-3-methyl-5-hydroxy-6-metoxy-1,4-benzoquinol methylase
MTDGYDEAAWDERYREAPALWSGHPNPQLISEASGLPTGTALDVGSGEGADAIWLAQRGWQVTAVDLSSVAIERATAHAVHAGAEVADRITWVHADVITWEPGAARFDLVSAQYMHLPPPQRSPLFARLADAVRPDGTLLIVGHHPSDLQTTMHRAHLPERFFTGDDIVSALDPSAWDVITNTATPRQATDPEGRSITIRDAVLRARRRSAS